MFSRRPWGRNECVTNEPQRTSAGRLKHYPDPVKDGHQCGVSALITQTSFHRETSNCVKKLLSQAIKLLLLSFES